MKSTPRFALGFSPEHILCPYVTAAGAARSRRQQRYARRLRCCKGSSGAFLVFFRAAIFVLLNLIAAARVLFSHLLVSAFEDLVLFSDEI